MINVSQSATASASFMLPEASSAVSPTVEGFSAIYSGNPTQFASKDQADALASFLGGKVTDLADQWSVFHVSPLYQVELPNGMSLNAGLLADRFRRYGSEAALKMTEAEIGASISIPAHNAAPVAAPPTAHQPSHTPATPALPASVPGTSSLAAANSPAGNTPPPSANVEQAKVLAAARQFEALLIGPILTSATPQDGGGVLPDRGDSACTAGFQLPKAQLQRIL